jgi:PAS domain S-box-containing protein
METALRESENKYRSLAEISIDMILTYDLQGKITYVNPVVEEISGYTPEEVIGNKFINYISPEFVDFALTSFQKGKQVDAIPLFELELIHKSGRKVPIELNPTSTYDTEGKIMGSLSIVRDITVRKKAERALQVSERKYKEQSHLFRLMSDNIPDMVWAKDLEGRFTFTNQAICTKLLIAKDTDEPIGKHEPYFAKRQRRLYPDRKNWYTFDKLCSDSDALVLKTKKPVRADEFGYVQDKFLYFDVYKAPIFDENNQIIGTVGHGRDITKEKEAEKALLLRDKALNVAANAIIITNADGEIEWVNEAFTRLSGYSGKEVLGKFTIDLVGTGKQDEAFYEKMHNILKSGQVWSGEFNDRRKNGTRYEVEEVITPVTDKNGKVEHLIGIMNDISERKIAERELLAAKETAEESSRLKSAFLANMNHEIRTPMNAIMGFSELMLEATPKEKATYAKIVNNSAGQLLHLIDDVIFLSRLQSEKLPVKKIIFSPANLMNEILFMFDLPEMKKGLEFQTRLPENAESIAMEADVDKIRQVLTSFISNAIKYTEEGYVKLGFEKRNNNILFFEEDSGMGIPKKEQQHIFEAFFRGSKAVNSAIRGTGLGLNIAKELVELMGGTIGVSSKPGKGSRFYFTLPYETPKSTFTKVPPHKLKPKKWKELNILIAEDDETNFLYLEVLLKEKVNRVDRACNGQEAVEMVRKASYDLILMDLKMPVMTGTEATLEIKKQYPYLTVIATTAYATPEEKEHALDAGCDDYLSKPIKKSDLMMHIEKYLSGKH